MHEDVIKKNQESVQESQLQQASLSNTRSIRTNHSSKFIPDMSKNSNTEHSLNPKPLSKTSIIGKNFENHMNSHVAKDSCLKQGRKNIYHKGIIIEGNKN